MFFFSLLFSSFTYFRFLLFIYLKIPFISISYLFLKLILNETFKIFWIWNSNSRKNSKTTYKFQQEISKVDSKRMKKKKKKKNPNVFKREKI